MLEKLNLYDLLGYVLPGATVVLTLYWSARLVGAPLPDIATDLGSSVAFLGLSYLVGQLVHSGGSFIEDELNKPFGGIRFYERLLIPSGEPFAVPEREGFSAGLQKQILDAATVVFSTGSMRREIFEQCYALVVQKSLAQHVEIFLGLTGLARSMLAASVVGIFCGLALGFVQVALATLGLFGVQLTAAERSVVTSGHYLVAWLLTIGFVLTGLMMYRIFRHFRLTFSKSVYFNFLAWYGEQKFTASLKLP